MMLQWKICAAAALLQLACWMAAGGSVTLAWDPNPQPNVAGYRVHYGGSSRGYTNVIDMGCVTNAVISNLERARYYFAIAAYDTAGVESDLSDEVEASLERRVLVTVESSPDLSGWRAIGVFTNYVPSSGFYRARLDPF